VTAPDLSHIAQTTHRLIASRWPTIGVFDRVGSTAVDIRAAYELEMLTNDRLHVPFERLHELPESEWMVGTPNANIVMAAYLHADEAGGRFTDGALGAWYCSFDLQTAIVETVFHHTRRLSHSAAGFYQTIQMRELRADVDATFHDLRGMQQELPALYSPVPAPSPWRVRPSVNTGAVASVAWEFGASGAAGMSVDDSWLITSRTGGASKGMLC